MAVRPEMPGVTFSTEEKFAEIKREIVLRRQVYPGSVKLRRMSQEEADRRIAVMCEIAKDYGGTG